MWMSRQATANMDVLSKDSRHQHRAEVQILLYSRKTSNCKLRTRVRGRRSMEKKKLGERNGPKPAVTQNSYIKYKF